MPKYPTKDPHYRILAHQRSRFPFQTTYYLNGHSFIEQELNRARIGFRKNDNAFLAVDDVAALQAAADRSCELGLWRLTANRIAEIFGTRLHRRHRGKLATVIDQIEHGHHVFRAYFKSAFLKQYEKFSTFLRNELCSNNLTDFGLKKGLDHLDAVRQTFQAITDRFAGFQAQCLNVHVDFPLLQRIALPITIGSVRYPGIQIHDTRVIRLCEVLLHGGTHVGGWTAKQIHQAVLTTFHLSDKSYGLNQLRYDLRKLKGHGLIERDGTRYAYRLTPKGVQVALLFLFFHKRLCGPLANSHFHHQPDAKHRPSSQLEAAYHRADKAINQIVELLQQPRERATTGDINVNVVLSNNREVKFNTKVVDVCDVNRFRDPTATASCCRQIQKGHRASSARCQSGPCVVAGRAAGNCSTVACCSSHRRLNQAARPARWETRRPPLLKSVRVNESGFEPLIVRHFLCLPFGEGIPISIQSGIDLTGRCKAVRNDLFIQLHRYTHLIAIPICFQQRLRPTVPGAVAFRFLD